MKRLKSELEPGPEDGPEVGPEVVREEESWLFQLGRRNPTLVYPALLPCLYTPALVHHRYTTPGYTTMLYTTLLGAYTAVVQDGGVLGRQPGLKPLLKPG